jgi:hypothetical protein
MPFGVRRVPDREFAIQLTNSIRILHIDGRGGESRCGILLCDLHEVLAASSIREEENTFLCRACLRAT